MECWGAFFSCMWEGGEYSWKLWFNFAEYHVVDVGINLMGGLN